MAKACAEQGVPLVVGTTGFDPEQRKTLEAASSKIALLVSPNLSRAVNLLMRLAGEAARALGDSADIEIVERHHHFKKDAPSGTALRLAEIVGNAVGSSQFVHGRQGEVGERPRGEIGLHALRTGDNPGEHTVVFGLMGECLELSHRALNRDGFALGRSTLPSTLPASRRGSTRWPTCSVERVPARGRVSSGRRLTAMALCDEGYRCEVCGQDVEDLTQSDLYLRYVLGEVDPETLHVSPERHLTCNPTLAQFIVAEDFPL